jgi:hypothetical protein
MTGQTAEPCTATPNLQRVWAVVEIQYETRHCFGEGSEEVEIGRQIRHICLSEQEAQECRAQFCSRNPAFFVHETFMIQQPNGTLLDQTNVERTITRSTEGLLREKKSQKQANMELLRANLPPELHSTLFEMVKQ